MKKTNKGFSMVELIIVIAIMAILAGALAPALIKYINKSRLSTDIQTGQTIATAIQTALSNETAYEAASDVTTATDVSSAFSSMGAFKTEFENAMGGSVPTKGKSKKDVDGTNMTNTNFLVKVETSSSKVEVYYDTADTAHQIYPTVGNKMDK